MKTGDAVDSERELAKIHHVSLMTARHALAALEQEGMVERRRGAGTFVAPPKIHFNKLVSFSEQMATRSLPVRSKVLSCGVIGREQDIAARLALPAGTRTAADPRTAQLLGIARGLPLIRIRQVIYSTKGKPALYALGLYRSDRHTLLIRRFR